MYKVHGYLDGKRVINWRMQHLPRTGDTMRFSEDKYGTVKEVVWCMDEDDKEGQRVNLRIESIADKQRLTIRLSSANPTAMELTR